MKIALFSQLGGLRSPFLATRRSYATNPVAPSGPSEGREPVKMAGDMITFEQARATLAAATGKPAADHGWENDDVFVVVNDFGAAMPPPGEPDYLVDKRTGELREVYGLLGRDPAPNLRPISKPNRGQHVTW